MGLNAIFVKTGNVAILRQLPVAFRESSRCPRATAPPPLDSAQKNHSDWAFLPKLGNIYGAKWRFL